MSWLARRGRWLSYSVGMVITTTIHQHALKIPASGRNLAAWAAARRRTALVLALRGACYGTGTGAIGLLTFWIQHHI